MVAQRLFPGLTAPLDLLVLQRGGHINCLQDHKSRTQPQLRLLPSIRHGPESAQLINYPITLPTWNTNILFLFIHEKKSTEAMGITVLSHGYYWHVSWLSGDTLLADTDNTRSCSSIVEAL
jgi:hypothetical protein